jgi:hypothetical protein
MIGVELMMLIQLSFLSFAMIDNAHPYAGPITQWKYISGYNEGIFPKKATNGNLSQFASLGFSDYFG